MQLEYDLGELGGPTRTGGSREEAHLSTMYLLQEEAETVEEEVGFGAQPAVSDNFPSIPSPV